MLKFQTLTHAPGPGAGGGAANSLPFSMQTQQQTNWCWAACAVSVGNYFHGHGKYLQCEVANALISESDCCELIPSADCNVYGYLDKALTETDSLDRWTNGAISLGTIANEIDSDEPVGTRVAWTIGGAHFMMITGYDTATNRITIRDPQLGLTTMEIDKYPQNYHGGGAWTHTYYTER